MCSALSCRLDSLSGLPFAERTTIKSGDDGVSLGLGIGIDPLTVGDGAAAAELLYNSRTTMATSAPIVWHRGRTGAWPTQAHSQKALFLSSNRSRKGRERYQ